MKRNVKPNDKKRFLIDYSFKMTAVRVICLLETGILYNYNLHLLVPVFEIQSLKTIPGERYLELDKKYQIRFSHFGSKFCYIFMCVLYAQHTIHLCI
jgi:hypothetical protein